MGIQYATAEDVAEVIEGAVIQRLEMCEGGARIVLVDGRTILIPEAERFFICTTRDILQ